jgi:glutamyl-tRNA synthetase
LGWNPKDNREYFTLDELVKKFDLKGINRSSAIFNIDKLDSVNSYYIKKKSDDEIWEWLKNDKLFAKFGEKTKNEEYVKKIIHILKDRLKRLDEFSEIASYFFKETEYKRDILIFKKSDRTKTKNGLSKTTESIEEASENVLSSVDELNKLLSDVVQAESLENGDVFWPVRVALSGLPASPSPAELIWVLGKEESAKRIKKAVEKLRIENE